MTTFTRRSSRVLLLPCLLALLAVDGVSADLRFEQEELGTRLQVGYAVRLLDMNGDKKLDVAIVDSKRFLWLENPTWKEHVVHADASARFDNVSFAPSDIDGDGTPDFAVGRDWQFGNTKSGGTIGWISSAGAGSQQDGSWPYLGFDEEPTTHRMNFADIDGDGYDELLVVPLKGRLTSGPKYDENAVRILAYEVPREPTQPGAWRRTVIDETTHVTHNFWPTDLDRDGRLDIITASFEGVSVLEREENGTWTRTRIGTGEQDMLPNRGASEIKSGSLGANQAYIATIEPWHGSEVVVYTRPSTPRPSRRGEEWLWKRQILDKDLKWGHAVSCADLDGDGAEELVVGVRDDKSPEWRRGLRIDDAQDARGDAWRRHLVDPGGVAIEDLAVGDLDGDGRPEIVAVGRQTHNVKIYWNRSR